jgi:hypothetical protein
MKATLGEVMGFFTDQPDRSGSIVATIGKLTDGFSTLVTQHIALAKMELAQDARVVGGELGRMAAFVPFLIVGYALLCGALAVMLGTWLGLAGGLAAVGAANVIGGGLGIYHALQRLRSRSVMDGTLQEFTRSAAAISQETARGTERPSHG